MPEKNSRMIDVQHHFYPPKFLAERAEALIKFSPGYAHIVDWTPQTSLDDMDRNGCAGAILSPGPPGVWLGDRAQSHRLTEFLNEFGAEMVRDHPTRFGQLATLPLPDIDFSLKQIEYACDVLKVDGFSFLSSYDGKWPGDPAFDPIFDELNRRKAIVNIHPTAGKHTHGLLPQPAPPIIEFMFDTTRAITNLLYSGTFARCPDITWLFLHGGGTLPFLADRIAMWARAMKNNKELMDRLPNGVEHELKRLNLDICSVCNPPAMAAILEFVPTTQLMLGSDMPFYSTADIQKDFEGVKHMLTPAQTEDIEFRTATRLFPRFARK
jgi:predicted TIM-barrel fold metal-dependent hydrolase